MFISEFKIDNFRSLKDVHLKQMQRVCIFHGDNNSGKSNILAAIEAVLRGKTIIEDPAAGGGENQPPYRKVPFIQGRLRDFSDNFRFGERDPIKFLICVTFDDSELAPYKVVIEKIQSKLSRAPNGSADKGKQIRGLKLNDGHDKIVRIEGELRYVDDSTCEAFTQRIDINSNFILFQLISDKPVYIPSLEKSKIPLEERENVVTNIVNVLTDSFRLIGTNRSMNPEKLSINEPLPDFLTPASFKRSMFRLATNRDTYELFKQIKERFNSPPFSFGDISFDVDPKTEQVEIMVEKSSTRLPLNRIGSGLQQILFLIGSIAYNSHRMIGVEEIELNLSPDAQKRIFETLKSLVYETKLINQAMVTSHSPYFRNRNDVKYYEVTYDQSTRSTVVKPSTKPSEKKFFAIPGLPET